MVARDALPPRGGVVLIDGGCSFCNRTRVWIERHAPPGRFTFHPLASDEGRAWLDAVGWRGPPPEAVVLIERRRWSMRSTAVLRIMRGLRGARRLLYGFIVVPRPLRDWAYGLVAKHRHRLRGV